jgi:tetraacyldisaccharide 4'-kinase
MSPTSRPVRSARWQQRLRQVWQSRGPLAWALLPVAGLYAALWWLTRLPQRLGWRQPQRLPVPVVVVGNVVVGGVGKTPIVIALAQRLQIAGVAVGIISRGHGRRSQACLEVQPDANPAEVGDEPLLLRQRTGCPVFVARQRALAGQTLLGRYPATQVLLCDDGLQHHALARDLELAVFDDRGVGNGWLLPAGPLREPWPRDVDLVLHTGAQPAFAGHRVPRQLASYAVQAGGSRCALSALVSRGQPLLALAAIAQPEAFFAMLRAQGVPLAHTLALPDHHFFDSGLRNELEGYTVICTEKDAVKLWPLLPQAWAVPLECKLPDIAWQAIWSRLKPLLRPAPGPLSSGHGHTTA